MSWPGGQSYGQPGPQQWGGAPAGPSKFDNDPAYTGGQPQYGGQPPQQYWAQPQQQYNYGGAPQFASGGGGGSKFDNDPVYSSGGQWSSEPPQQQPYGGMQSSYGAPPQQYGAPPQFGGAPPPQQQQQWFDGRQNGVPLPPQQPLAPQPGHAPAFASQPMQPLAHGPGPHPVAPYAPGMQQPAAPGPQGQGCLSGRKRAVLCGCNYRGTSSQLNGCINDAQCMKYLLTKRFNFQEADIRLLTDDSPDPRCWPTRANITAAIHWLVDSAQAGDDLFFHFSGHGSQEIDRSGEETSGKNDTILPCDFKRAGQISDNELNQRLCNPLRQGARLHAVIDACHSGSALDLPFRCKIKGGIPTWKSEYVAGRVRSHKGTAGGLAIQIAAAGDSETAADTSALSGGTSTGAATYAFIQAIEQHGTQITYGALLLQMDKVLHSMGGGSGVGGMVESLGVGKLLGGFSKGNKIMGMLEGGLSAAGLRGGQTPQISANYAFDMSTPLQM